MAHIPDGVLSAPVLAAGGAITAAGCAYALRRLDPERIPEVAVLCAAFFVASLVHFPVGPSSVHLLLSGLIGVMIGWSAFPAVLVALLLQAILFGFGGLVVLGANTVNMAVPAVICGGLFRLVLWHGTRRQAIAMAGFCGAFGVLLTALFVALDLWLSGREFVPAAKLVVVAHVPVMAIEAVFTAAAVSVLLRAKPEYLGVGALEEEAHA